MMIIISYDDYVIKYGGGFPFPDGTIYGDGATEHRNLLDKYSRKANAKLEQYKRIYTVSVPADTADKNTDLEFGDGFKLKPEEATICAMIEAMMIHDAAKEDAVNRVSAASIGSVSVSYGNSSGVDISDKALEKELFRCASRYLDIYRGVG